MENVIKDFQRTKRPSDWTARRQIIIGLHSHLKTNDYFYPTLSRSHAGSVWLGHASQQSDPGHTLSAWPSLHLQGPSSIQEETLTRETSTQWDFWYPVAVLRKSCLHNASFMLAGSANHHPQSPSIQPHVASWNANYRYCHVTMLAVQCHYGDFERKRWLQVATF